MNSSTMTQPETNGPASSRMNGFATRNPMMVSLYQRGALPRKLRPTAVVMVRSM